MAQHTSNTLFRLNLSECSAYFSDPRYIIPSTVRIFVGRDTLATPSIVRKGDSISVNEVDCEKIKNRTAVLEFRVFPFDFSRSYFIYDTTQMSVVENETYVGLKAQPFGGATNNALIEGAGLNYRGSFSRGFSVGNAQSLVLNSDFDLQLDGDLGDGILIKAVVSDDNIPIQTEGSTQTLQEFDRVYIELSKNEHRVVAGDFVLERPKSYFANYYKKLKGLGAGTSVQLGALGRIDSKATVAVSRGKFARQIIGVSEGNQGPYRLQGNNDERFIIVLSGSEKIYFNGELLKRGLENDYTIDYNTADVTFSPNRLIVRETRIIVEFEYTVFNYFRSLYHIETNFSSDKLNLDFNFYSEQDGRTAAGTEGLDSLDLVTLANSGDRRDLAVRSGVRPIADDQIEVIGYRWVANPNFPTDTTRFILVFTSNPDSVQVTAAFSEVGLGKGSYAIDEGNFANGRVYRYIGPGQGLYAPVRELVPPELKRMVTMGANYRIGKYTRLYGELALTGLDQNRFSALDNEDNNGIGGVIGYESSLGLGDSTNWRLTHFAQVETVDDHFNPLNPYRNAEFIRDWNRSSQYGQKEVLLNGGIGLRHSDFGHTQYQYTSYESQTGFSGVKHGADINLQLHKYHLSGRPSLVLTRDGQASSEFIRPNFITSYRFHKLDNAEIGVIYEGEINTFEHLDSIGYLPSSYAFDHLRSYFKTNPNRALTFQFFYNIRKERLTEKTEWLPSLDIKEVEFQSGYLGEISRLNLSLKARNFDVLLEERAELGKSRNTLLGALDYTLSSRNKVITAATAYQINSGQEALREYVFQRVENIQGEYVYIGNDSSGVLNINDFRYDPTNPLASYIRIGIPNNAFVRTNNLLLNQSLRFDAANFFKGADAGASKWTKFASLWSTNSIFRVQSKSMDSGSENQDPFNFRPVDTSLVQFTKLMNHTVFFNRSGRSYDAALSWRNTDNRFNQINGLESRSSDEKELRIRLSIIRNLDIIGLFVVSNRMYDSELFDLRDFDIDGVAYNPKVSWRIGTTYRIQADYAHEFRRQRIGLLESADIDRMTAEFNWREQNNVSLDAKVSYVRIAYNGEANAQIEYDLLDGLKNGNNWLWNVRFTRRMANNIDLILSYLGRKTGSAPVVHVASMQAKATF